MAKERSPESPATFGKENAPGFGSPAGEAKKGARTSANGADAYCTTCGSVLRAGAQFCPTCGTAVEATGAARLRPLPVLAAAALIVAVSSAITWSITRDDASVVPNSTEEPGRSDADLDADGGGRDLAGENGFQPAIDPDDLRDVTLPLDACGEMVDLLNVSPPLTLVDGSVPGSGQFEARVELVEDHPPTVADLDGDGGDEGILVLQCFPGGSSHTHEIHVYGPGGEHLDGVQVGVDFPANSGVQTLDIDRGAITVTATGLREGEPNCCGTLQITEVHRFDDGQFLPAEVALQ